MMAAIEHGHLDCVAWLHQHYVWVADEACKHAAKAGHAHVLAYLHEQGIIYRDLKPQNVLFTDDNHVRLSDFGLRKKYFGIDKEQVQEEQEMRAVIAQLKEQQDETVFTTHQVTAAEAAEVLHKLVVMVARQEEVQEEMDHQIQ